MKTSSKSSHCFRGVRPHAGIFIALWLGASPVFAQGWVNFINGPSTLFSVATSNGAQVGMNGTYYFSLLVAPAGAADLAQFTFSGLYATNLAFAGRFSGGTFVPAPNWAVGTTKSYFLAGWSASLGADWQQAWLDGVFSQAGYFGLSTIGTGEAGGIIDTNRPPLPPLNLFGGTTGIRSGFTLEPVGVPEPALPVFVGLGTAVVFSVHAFRKNPNGRC